MIKNRTLYLGKPFLKIEKYPHYSGSSVLNKIHINFGFVKLVSRVRTLKYNKDLIEKICADQECELKWHIYDDEYNRIYLEEYDDTKRCYPNISFKGQYVSLDSIFMYYKHGWKVEGHGLAKVIEHGEHIGYCGHSHRGGTIYKIGNKIYDKNFHMDEFHPSFKKYKKALNKSKYATHIEEVVPFVEHGNITIETLEQAKEAAIALSNYLG